jgi:hypothetical protein
MKTLRTFLIMLLLFVLAQAQTTGFKNGDRKEGLFWRVHWFEDGAPHGNPGYQYNNRFRVNSPEVGLHPQYGKRPEPRGNGMMLIKAEEDLSLLREAELYLELWGGHPATVNKRLTINGRSQYAIPENGTANYNCTHLYPSFALKLTDLVNGYNAVQFACDQGESFWGHFIVEQAALRTALKNDHPDLVKSGLQGFTATVSAVTNQNESVALSLQVPEAMKAQIAAVDYQGWYGGYDENGDGLRTDWHGFTKMRQPVAYVAAAVGAPFAATWDVTMLPDQPELGARAIIHFKDRPELIYVTAPTRGIAFPKRSANVTQYHAHDLPRAFWSRAKNRKVCHIELNLDPGEIERAQLHVIAWDGGAGAVKDYFTLNGQQFDIAGKAKHDVIYSTINVNPALLKRGANRIELYSDTEHHGIEILLPGPALMIRRK